MVGLFISFAAQSQTNSPSRRDADISKYLQDLFPVQTEGIDYQAVYDALTQLYASPLDLNTASREELEATYLLTERQLSNLASYRTGLGDLLSI